MNIPTKFEIQLAQWFQRSRLKTNNTLIDTLGPLASFMYSAAQRENAKSAILLRTKSTGHGPSW